MCVYLCIPAYHVFLFCVVMKQIRPSALCAHQVLSDRLQGTPNRGRWEICLIDGIT